jgi:hypothetical protein
MAWPANMAWEMWLLMGIVTLGFWMLVGLDLRDMVRPTAQYVDAKQLRGRP